MHRFITVLPEPTSARADTTPKRPTHESSFEFLEEAEELFHANAFEEGDIENVVTRETLDRMVKELATHTHPEDKQRYASTTFIMSSDK
eukprot:1182119-Prorocentrum_minimum.AAC.3